MLLPTHNDPTFTNAPAIQAWINAKLAGQEISDNISEGLEQLAKTGNPRERAGAENLLRNSYPLAAIDHAKRMKYRAFDVLDKMPSGANLHDYHLVVLNSSAGKDSQAMIDFMVRLANQQSFPLSRVRVVHADLGRCEWAGTRQLAELQARHYGLQFEAAEAVNKAGDEQDLIDQIIRRGDKLKAEALETGEPLKPAFPSSTTRYCTSDQKRGPCQKVITRWCSELEVELGVSEVKVLNCLGIRAEESGPRAKKNPWEYNKGASTKVLTKWRDAKGKVRSVTKRTKLPEGAETWEVQKRRVQNWFPIFDKTALWVWSTIKASGCAYHWAYDIGMPRLSCIFCVFAPQSALTLAALYNRNLLETYIQVEDRVGTTFAHKFSLRVIAQSADTGKLDDIGSEAQDWCM